MRKRLNARARAALVRMITEGVRMWPDDPALPDLRRARCVARETVMVTSIGALVMYDLTPRGRARALTLVEGSPERLRTLRPRKPGRRAKTIGIPVRRPFDEVLANAAATHAANKLAGDLAYWGLVRYLAARAPSLPASRRLGLRGPPRGLQACPPNAQNRKWQLSPLPVPATPTSRMQPRWT